MENLVKGKDGKMRCFWCNDAPEYIDYHDNEWGRPVHDDIRLFEKLSLEGFQAGLSWITILRKRENFRVEFKNFDFYKVAKFTEKDIERMLQNPGIIRHRGKIEAVINNAKLAIKMVEDHGSLAKYFWEFKSDEKAKPVLRSESEESKRLSKALKKMGWKFVGPTTVYAFMQAMGMVNDHFEGCFVRKFCVK